MKFVTKSIEGEAAAAGEVDPAEWVEINCSRIEPSVQKWAQYPLMS